MEFVKSEDNVLIIWNNNEQSDVTHFFNEIVSVAQKGTVCLENSTMINNSSQPQSFFDIVLSNMLPPYAVVHDDNLLSIIVKILKPSGKLILKDTKDVSSVLKLNGFVNIMADYENLYIAEKPKFEVGSKVALNFRQKPGVWKLEDAVEDVWSGANDDDIIDADQLLDEDDLKKPDKQSLRVCSTTGKRKACADCSCGLAEELKGETKETPKSSCGSCYLGDAFRCATCPYLGMPAFKPGEKVLLDLKSDI